MIDVKYLLLKTARGDNPLKMVSKLTVSTNGIVDNIPCLPTRQVLILPYSTILDYALAPGDLRENIIIDGLDLHSLESGTILTIGEVDIRLTYHCEPCGRVKPFVNPNKILHKRGYLGSFLSSGNINIGDKVIVGNKQYESIPYDIKERIIWFLDNRNERITIKDLAFEVGLSQSYYRAIPNLMKKMDVKYKNLVVTQKQETLQPQFSLFD